MKRFALIISLAVLSMLTFIRCDDDDDINPTETAKFITFSNAMHELWSDHVVWTRDVIIHVMDDLPGTDLAVNRLLQNQVDIGDAIKPYYGDAAGEALTDLLNEHITTAADLLIAAKTENDAAFNAANTAWYANADSIAVFLNNANPDNFDLNHWKGHMKDHLDLTLDEAVARLTNDHAADIAAFDAVYEQVMEMADMLARGIANQFPDKF